MKNIGKYAMIALMPLAAAVVSCDDEFEVVGENPPLEQMLKIECMENVEFDAYGGVSDWIICIYFMENDFTGLTLNLKLKLLIGWNLRAILIMELMEIFVGV